MKILKTLLQSRPLTSKLNNGHSSPLLQAKKLSTSTTRQWVTAHNQSLMGMKKGRCWFMSPRNARGKICLDESFDRANNLHDIDDKWSHKGNLKHFTGNRRSKKVAMSVLNKRKRPNATGSSGQFANFVIVDTKIQVENVKNNPLSSVNNDVQLEIRLTKLLVLQKPTCRGNMTIGLNKMVLHPRTYLVSTSARTVLNA